MNSRQRTCLALIGAVVMGGSGVFAETNLFTNTKGDNLWGNPENWSLQQCPTPEHKVYLSNGSAITLLNTNVVVGALRLGTVGACSLVIDGGSLTTVGQSDWWSSVNYASASSSLTIQNGGKVTMSKYLVVGRKDSRGGSVVIHKGTLRVEDKYFHNAYYDGTNTINTRTTINTDGVLDVEGLVLNAGVLDIAGGTVIVRQYDAEKLAEWVKIGRIIAMGGLDGWRVKITLSEETGWMTLTAEQEEIVLGKTPSPRSAENSPHRAG